MICLYNYAQARALSSGMTFLRRFAADLVDFMGTDESASFCQVAGIAATVIKRRYLTVLRRVML
jgi:hypothetical protein